MAAHQTTTLPPDWYRWTVQSINTYAIFTMDLNSRILTWDQGATAMFGYRRDDVLGENARFIFTPEDIQQRVPELEIVNAVGQRAALDERWHVRKDGSVFWASGFMMVITDDVGRQIGFVKMLREAQPPE